MARTTRVSSRSRRADRVYDVVRVNPTDREIHDRFNRCVATVGARGGIRSPEAICATSMRKAYGEQFQRIAAEGRSLAAAQRHARGMVLSRKTGRLERRPASRLRPTAVQRRGIARRLAREKVERHTARAREPLYQALAAVANPTSRSRRSAPMPPPAPAATPSWVVPTLVIGAIAAGIYFLTRPGAAAAPPFSLSAPPSSTGGYTSTTPASQAATADQVADQVLAACGRFKYLPPDQQAAYLRALGAAIPPQYGTSINTQIQSLIQTCDVLVNRGKTAMNISSNQASWWTDAYNYLSAHAGASGVAGFDAGLASSLLLAAVI